MNAVLRRLISFFPKIHFWKHCGILFDYRSLVSDDGVHLSPVGDRLFYRSIRGSALFLSKLIHYDGLSVTMLSMTSLWLPSSSEHTDNLSVASSARLLSLHVMFGWPYNEMLNCT